MKIIQIRNNTSSTQEWFKSFEPNEEFELPIENPSLIAKYANFEPLLVAIANGDASIGNGTAYFTTLNEQLNWIKGNGADQVDILSASPFASKVFENKKLYKRVTGQQAAVYAGSNTILHTITYPWVKITGIECLGAELLDFVSFYVLDSTTGTYTTVPNFQLNQFGFDVNLRREYYKHESEFDADLYQGMQIKVVYNSVSAKTIGINYILNEVK
jgi:hypothetical protein